MGSGDLSSAISLGRKCFSSTQPSPHPLLFVSWETSELFPMDTSLVYILIQHTMWVYPSLLTPANPVVIAFLIETFLRGGRWYFIVNVISCPSWLMTLSSIGIYYPSAIFSFLWLNLSSGPILIFNWAIWTFSFAMLVCEFLHIFLMNILFYTCVTDIFSQSMGSSFYRFLCCNKHVSYISHLACLFLFSIFNWLCWYPSFTSVIFDSLKN